METAQLERPYPNRFKPKYYNQAIFHPVSIDIDLILGEVEKVMKIPAEKFLLKSRKREYVLARQVSMVMACSFTKKSQQSIGEQIAGKDHSTVSHACKTINNLIDTKDPEVMSVYPQVFSKLQEIQTQISNGYNDLRRELFEDKADSIFNTEK